MKKAHMGASPAKSILATFAVIILAGTFLLMLPQASASGDWTDFATALFTATSAACVTGLSVVDALAGWTRFGHIVILLLVQIGGLGFIVFATAFASVLNHRATLRERLAISQSLSVDSMHGIVHLAKKIVFRSLLMELAGAMLLSVRLVPLCGFGEGLFMSIFHSVSAFCNAGIDILGANGGGLSAFATDPLVCLTLVALMVTGGLGFFVWEDIGKRRFSLHTKLTLVCTLVLLISGAIFFMVFEWGNLQTMGNFDFWEKLLASFFQSATCRSAGFCMLPQSEMTFLSKGMMMLLMFIGGSPGSTAGGVKTVTVAVCLLAADSAMRGKREVAAFGRKISHTTVYKCICIVFIGISLVLFSTVLISLINIIPVQKVLFECVAAFSTAGISAGITAELNDASRLILLVLMYFGRVGILTVGLSLTEDRQQPKIEYPEGKILIG